MKIENVFEGNLTTKAKEIIVLTVGAYGADKFREFFEKSTAGVK